MELIIPNFKIEQSVHGADQNNLIETKISRIIADLSEGSGKRAASISGQPMHIWRVDGHEAHFEDCEKVNEVRVVLGRISWSHLPDPSNLLPSKYTVNDFPVLSCYDKDTTEYSMPMHSVFGFKLEYDIKQ